MTHTILYRRHRLKLIRAVKANYEEQLRVGAFEDAEERAALMASLVEVTKIANKRHAELLDAEWRARSSTEWPPTEPAGVTDA